MPPILQLDLEQIVSQSISFLLLWWLLRRFAWRPLLALLDHRRAHIEEELRRVASNGERMPQKSTYFYPKLLTGLIVHKQD